MCPNKAETRLLWLSLPSGSRRLANDKKAGREPILPENDRKPFRMIFLQEIRQQLTWIDILTKNTGGWGCIPFCSPPIQSNAAALGAGSNPFSAGCCVPHLEHTS
jgi:hypothetical protein